MDVWTGMEIRRNVMIVVCVRDVRYEGRDYK
jgi:hypothetical protein